MIRHESDKERKTEMKLALTRISLFAIKAQKYIPIAAMLLVVAFRVIGMNPPEGGGGGGIGN